MLVFLLLSWVCFGLSLSLPFRNVADWNPSAMGPVIICSAMCTFLLGMQLKNVVCYGYDDFWGKAFILWSIFHMMAAVVQVLPFMFVHFLWVFSSACWQVSNELITTSVWLGCCFDVYSFFPNFGHLVQLVNKRIKSLGDVVVRFCRDLFITKTVGDRPMSRILYGHAPQ